MKKLLLAAIALTLSFPAMADRWVVFGGDHNRVNLINLSNIKRNGNTAKAWTAYVNINPKLAYDIQIERIGVNCYDESMSISSVFEYRKSKLINSEEAADKWFTPPPGSIGQVAIMYACSPKEVDTSIGFETDDIKKKVPEIQGVMREIKKELEKNI